MNNHRKPVVVYDGAWVVCDDGSIWTMAPLGLTAGITEGEWEEGIPIPGTKRAEELAEAEQASGKGGAP